MRLSRKKKVSIQGEVETLDNELCLRIPLNVGGQELAPFAEGIGTVVDGELRVFIPPWLAEKLEIGEGSTVGVDNLNGKFRISPLD